MIRVFAGRRRSAGKSRHEPFAALLTHVVSRSLKKMKEIARTVARVREFVQELPSTTMQVQFKSRNLCISTLTCRLQFDGGVSVTVETLGTRPAAAVAMAQSHFAASDSEEEISIKVAPPPLKPPGSKKKIGVLRPRGR